MIFFHHRYNWQFSYCTKVIRQVGRVGCWLLTQTLYYWSFTCLYNLHGFMWLWLIFPFHPWLSETMWCDELCIALAHAIPSSSSSSSSTLSYHTVLSFFHGKFASEYGTPLTHSLVIPFQPLMNELMNVSSSSSSSMRFKMSECNSYMMNGSQSWDNCVKYTCPYILHF